jgi:hypothetical protein
VLGIFDDTESKEMNTALSTASKIDCNAKRAEVNTDSETKTTFLKWIKMICINYTGHIIHCTMDLKDNTGQAICEVITMQNHNLMVELFDYKMQHLEHIAERLM